MKSFYGKIMLLIIVCLVLLCSAAYAATEYTDGDYTYVLSGKNATITAYSGAGEGELTIPSALGGHTVTAIYVEAFADCTKLTKVTVPDTVTSIAVGAFKGCTSLEEMTLPFIGGSKGAENDQNATFGYIFGSEGENLTRQYYKNQNYKDWAIPKSLKKVTITKDTSIAYGSFYNCTMLESVTLPNTTGIIGKFAFYNCTNLKEVIIPDNYQSIYESAFENCSSLEQISLPDNISSLSKSAFSGCTALKSIELPAKVTQISENLFYNCTSLEDITFNGNVTLVGSNAFYNTRYLNNSDNFEDGCLYLDTILINVSKTSETINVKPDTTSIYPGAFSGCSSLKKLTIPDTISHLGARFLKDCMAIEELTLPWVGVSKGANATESTVFGAIFNYSNTQLGEGYIRQYYNNGGNDYCYYLIPATLKKVTITAETVVPYGAFQNCSMIEEIILPDTVGDIRRESFTNCTSLKKITLPSKLSSLVTGMFKGCTSLKTVDIPAGVTTINDSVFLNCASLEEIELPQNLRTIGVGVFKGCTSLKSIDLPDGVTTMGNNVFMGCSSLNSVTLGTALKTIGVSAFEDCVALGSISIPQTVTTIYRDAFKNTLLTNTSSNYVEGVLCIDGWAIAALSEVQSISVPDGTKYIAQEAFKDRTNLKEATLPQTIEKIGSSAFAGCTSLEKLTIPFVGLTPGESGNYENVFGALFEMPSTASGATNQQYSNSSSSTKYYKIPQSIKEVEVTGSHLIPFGAFYNCANLQKVTLCNDITSVNEKAFYGCTALKEVNIPASVTEIKPSTFYGCASLEAVAIPTGVKKISDSAFRNCTLLTNPTFPETLETIGASAYEECSSIDKLTVPKSVKEIGQRAFRGCASLEEVTLPFIGIQRGVTDKMSHVFGYIFGGDSYSSETTIPQRYKEGNVYYYHIPQTIRKVTITDETIVPYGAFDGCSFIDEIIIEGAPETIGVYAFGNFSGEALDVTIKDKQVKFNEGEAFGGSPMATLYGYSNSTSEAYADVYDVDFVPIDGKDNAYGWQKYRIESLYITEGDNRVDGVPSSEFKAVFTLTNQGGYANDMIAVVFFTEDGIMSHLALQPIDVPFGKTGLVECKVDNRSDYADNFKIFMLNGVNIAPLSIVKTYK